MKEVERRCGFTLVELMVTIAIIAVVVGVTIPVVQGARRSAASTACQSNLRQLASALINYASHSNGKFPSNNGANALFWFDSERVIRPFVGEKLGAKARQGKPSALRCPADIDTSVRSYSMNVFASSAASTFVTTTLAAETPPRGKMFTVGEGPASKLILLIEATASPTDSQPNLLASPAVVGWGPRYPGHRFGAASATRRWWQVDYSRHAPRGRGSPEKANGRLNIAFLDGHVAQFAHTDLANFDSTRSRYEALWSPVDADAETILPR